MICAQLVTAFAAPTPPAWTHQAWQLSDGLPNNYVVGAARTPDGYLWVGTRTNLARFDGVRFETIPMADLWRGPPQGLRLVLPAPDGGLWVGLDSGIIFHLKDGAVRSVQSASLNLVPSSLVEENRDVIWATYRKGIVYRLEAGSAELIGAEHGLPAGTSCSVARDITGEIWCARGRSLGRLRGKKFEPVCALESKDAVICAARGGGLWIFSNWKLLRLSLTTGLSEAGALEPRHSAFTPLQLLEDRSGAVWLGTYENGLLRFRDGRVDAISTSDRQIESLAEERDGSIWVGTAGGGLNRISRQAISRETDDKGAVVNALSLCEDSAGVIWAAGINGDLLRRSDAGWQAIESTEQMAWRAKWVSAVGADRDGSIWIGTHHQSVHRLTDGKLTTFNRAAGIESQWINCVLATRAGGLWVAGEKPDALHYLEDGRFVSLALPPEIRSIRALTEDAAGDIWVGGRTGDSRGIVLRVSGGRITNERENPMAPPRPIRSTCRTDNGDLWMGASGEQGLVRLRQGRFAVVGREQGLFDSAISQVVADREGWIWCAADHGLFKVRQQELDAVIEGRAAEVHSVRFNVEAGFGGPPGMASVSPGALCDRQGRLWIPMRSALLRVDPTLLPQEDRPPAVHIERVVVDREVVASYGGLLPARAADLRTLSRLAIPALHRRLEIQFTALSLGAPENKRLRYRLDGFDDDWIEINGPRVASYPHLPGGNYRFHVIACNADGIWNNAGASLAFAVAPFFWQTWWFRTIAVVAFSALVAVAVRYVSFRRLRRGMQALQQQTALADERSRIARDLHDQFGSRLTELAMIATSESHQAGARGSPSELVPVIRELEHDLDTIIWAVNPENDTLNRVIPYCCRMAGEFLRRSSMACHFEIPDEIPARQVTPEFRHNIYLVFREATNNVAKHSRATRAHICVTLEGGKLTVRFDDNGRGFDVPAAESRGRSGLANMRNRVAELGGVFRVESAPDTNTVIHFSIPLPPSFA
ncbi:MAG TPA: two-component regulator propeller domain-containing protein [Opitutaceae bacterium]|nr:two-component regulator propeller domain-containing protein [Opitutaceae bacterium]